MSRPKLELSIADAEKLGMLGATYEEMAAWFDCNVRTIERRMAMGNSEFCRAYKKGLGRLKVSLRRQQIEAAKGGNPTMLIWLGKQLLGQQDKAILKTESKITHEEVTTLTPEQEEFIKRKAEIIARM
jgi:hypothetical protein